MRKIFISFVLACSLLFAASYPSVTYTFPNKTIANPTQVNTNFSNIISGISDGSKRLNVYEFYIGGTSVIDNNRNAYLSRKIFFQGVQALYYPDQTTFAGSFFVGNGGQSIATSGLGNVGIGVDALYAITNGNSNTAIGNNSLETMTAGYWNTSIGSDSMKSSSTGIWNTAIGTQAMYSTVTGSYNTAIGVQSLFSDINGRYNTAIGPYSLYSNSSGQFNLAIGTQALYSNGSGTGNVAIGYGAGGTETGSNKLYIESSGPNTTSTNSLIYGDFSTDLLVVNGQLNTTSRPKDKTGLIMPVGSILQYGGTTAPDGWFLCDGVTKDKTTYADLYAVISGNFGVTGNAFYLPDMRGRFVRGLDSVTVSRDPDALTRTAMNEGGNVSRNVGSIQNDAFESHTHASVAGNGGAGAAGPTYELVNFGYATDVQSTGGNETRPLNVYLNYIIKY